MEFANTVVLGVGNTLMRDDGIGVIAVRHLEKRNDARFSCLDGGTLGHLLLGYVYQTRPLIVLDAAQMNVTPGTVRVFENEEMDSFLNTYSHSSVHEVGLSDLVDMARITGHLPHKRALIAVQSECTDWGTELSPSVSKSIPLISEHIIQLIERWQK